jgi:hypothetical protein
MISSTTYDLEEILHGINQTMRDPDFQNPTSPSQNGKIQSTIEEERASIQQCLKICLQVSSHIDQVQEKELESETAIRATLRQTTVTTGADLARLITNEALKDCKRGIGFTAVELQARLKDADRRLRNMQKREGKSGADGSHQDLETLSDSIKQCLSICNQATEQASTDRVNVFEDVFMGDDGHQLIISTMGDLISARRVTVGARSIQWLGQMSDTSLQQLSKDSVNDVVDRFKPDRGDAGIRFENQHGTGRKLS